MSDITVLLDKIRCENDNLQSAIDEFKAYDRSYIESLLACLDGMHSDYINYLKKTLENVADTRAPILVKHAGEYSSAIRASVDAFDNKDKEIADRIKE